MGILPTPAKTHEKAAATRGKRQSMQDKFAKLKPLNPNGMRGFTGFRDPNERSPVKGDKKGRSGKRRADDGDSDEEPDNDSLITAEDVETKEANAILSPDDVKRQEGLAEGVRRIHVSQNFHLRLCTC